MRANENSPTAVRERRDFMAELIGHVADAQPMASILAAACGHLHLGGASL